MSFKESSANTEPRSNDETKNAPVGLFRSPATHKYTSFFVEDILSPKERAPQVPVPSFAYHTRPILHEGSQHRQNSCLPGSIANQESKLDERTTAETNQENGIILNFTALVLYCWIVPFVPLHRTFALLYSCFSVLYLCSLLLVPLSLYFCISLLFLCVVLCISLFIPLRCTLHRTRFNLSCTILHCVLCRVFHLALHIRVELLPA